MAKRLRKGKRESYNFMDIPKAFLRKAPGACPPLERKRQVIRRGGNFQDGGI